MANYCKLILFDMKKAFNLIVMLFLPLQICFAGNVKKVNVTFNKNDFTLSVNSSGLLDITSSKQIVSYGEDVSEPGLPLVPVNVLIPEGSSFVSLTVSASKSLIRENVIMATNPRMAPTDKTAQDGSDGLPIYANKVYPASSGVYKCTSCMDGYTLLNFLVSPFEYDAYTKKLYLNESVTLSINLENSNEMTSTLSMKGNNVSDIIKSLVVNSEDVGSRNISIQSKSTNSTNGNIEYLIITSRALSSYFQQIAQWKKMKGISSKVMAIEDIETNYTGATIPHKIKSCLYDLYKNNGLKYVLLGGDDTIVPKASCCVSAGGYTEKEMPTDLFFACFGGNFDWDGNKNGIYGETTDGIDMSPSIYVTRIPIRTSTDIIAFSTKLLTYEKKPLKGGWGNNMLMSGTRLWNNYTSTQSDAEAKGDNLYSNFIKPYWSGTRKKFYDTYTDFTGGADYNLNTANLQEQFANGYNFFDIASHGSPNLWALEYGRYHSSDAASMKSNGFTIITTMACQTNQFDSQTYDPCLSEAFIRNANNGVVAYLGCSRYGWGYSGGNRSLGPSLQYEAKFYQSLFSTTIENKNFGAIVAVAKAAMISNCTSNSSHRWVQFGLNPIGDPEMPIFTSNPLQFSGVTIKAEGNGIKVNSTVNGCNICVMSTDDNGVSYYSIQKNVKEATFSNINSNVSVCITKQNYIPYIGQVTCISIQNETINTDRNYEADLIKVGSAVTSSKAQGPVLMNSCTIKLKAKSITIEPTTTISKNVDLTLSNE